MFSKERLDRHACAPEHPRAADPCQIAFNGRAPRPIQHVARVTLGCAMRQAIVAMHQRPLYVFLVEPIDEQAEVFRAGRLGPCRGLPKYAAMSKQRLTKEGEGEGKWARTTHSR
jgi:hypothetical protein